MDIYILPQETASATRQTEAGKFAQDTSSLLGKILRIDVNGTADTGQNYLIPADNPFASGEGRPEIFAYGFRNPYRFSFDVSEADQSPRLFVADVGQAMMEEVSLVEAGGNYGWPIREGISLFQPTGLEPATRKLPNRRLDLSRSLHIRMRATCPRSLAERFIVAKPYPIWLAVTFSATGDEETGACSLPTLQLWE